MWQEIDGKEWYDLAAQVAEERYIIDQKQVLSKYPVKGRVHQFEHLLTIWGYHDAPYLKAEIHDGGSICYYKWEGK